MSESKETIKFKIKMKYHSFMHSFMCKLYGPHSSKAYRHFGEIVSLGFQQGIREANKRNDKNKK